MKDIKTYINESNDIEFIVEMTNNEYKDFLTKQQNERISVLKNAYKDFKDLDSFFNNLKSFNGSQYQTPMMKNSIYICFGDNNNIKKDFFYYYDNIFIQFGSSKEKYAVYLNKETGKIAICKDMHISYSGQNKDKASFLQDDGTYGSITNDMTWLDISSEVAQKELEKFKL